MASYKQIASVLGLSILIVAAIGFWVDSKNQEPERLLSDAETLDGPLAPKELEVTNPTITNDMNHIATLSTNKGIVRIELFEDQMPITTSNFIKLAQEGFYNETKFHRVIKGFMIQGGDPNSKTDEVLTYGRGGPGYTIQDEFVDGEILSNTRGTIAMANTGQPNSGGSQFFINVVDNTSLDFNKPPLTSKHPVFGRVIEGMDVVDSIASAETGNNDLPVDPIVIETVTIDEQ